MQAGAFVLGRYLGAARKGSAPDLLQRLPRKGVFFYPPVVLIQRGLQETQNGKTTRHCGYFASSFGAVFASVRLARCDLQVVVASVLSIPNLVFFSSAMFETVVGGRVWTIFLHPNDPRRWLGSNPRIHGQNYSSERSCRHSDCVTGSTRKTYQAAQTWFSESSERLSSCMAVFGTDIRTALWRVCLSLGLIFGGRSWKVTKHGISETDALSLRWGGRC